jgi:hypothetical protein
MASAAAPPARGKSRGGKAAPRGKRAGGGRSSDVPPPAPVVPLVAAAKVPAPAAPLVSVRPVEAAAAPTTFAQNVAEYKLALPRNQPEVVNRARDAGYVVHEYASTTPHSHPMSAAIRARATVEALGVLHALGDRNVVSLYGSDRDPAIVARLNANVPSAEHLHLQVVGSAVVPQDLARRRRLADPSDALGVIDAVMIVDVYMMAAGRAFTANHLAYLVAAGIRVVWIGHNFNGVAGTVEGEGAWFRKPEGIVYYADADSASYPPHDPCDWLFQQSVAETPNGIVSWAVVRTIGDTSVVLAEARLLENAPRIAPVAPKWEVVPLPNLSNWAATWAFEKLPAAVRSRPTLWTWMFSQRYVLIDPRIVSRLVVTLHGRSVDRFSFRQALQQARTLILDTKGWKLLFQRFPVETSEFVMGCTVAAMTRAPHDAAVYHAMNLALGDAFEQHNDQLAAIGKPASTGGWVFLLGMTSTALACAILALSVRIVSRPLHWGGVVAQYYEPVGWYARSRAAVLQTWKLLCDPLRYWPVYLAACGAGEEVIHHSIKSVNEPFSWALRAIHICFEFSYFVPVFATFGPQIGIASMVVHAGKHVVLHALPSSLAVPAHALHNYWIGMISPTGAVTPGEPVSFANAPPLSMGWFGLGCLALAGAAVGLYRWFCSPPPENPWTTFRGRHYSGRDAAVEVIAEATERITEFPPLDAIVPKQRRSAPIPAPQGQPVAHVHRNDEQPLDDDPYCGTMFYLVPTNSPGLSPGTTDSNRLYMLQARILKTPPAQPWETVAFWTEALQMLLATGAEDPFDTHDVTAALRASHAHRLAGWIGLQESRDSVLGPYQGFVGQFPFRGQSSQVGLTDLSYADRAALEAAWLSHFLGDNKRYNRAKAALEDVRRNPLTIDEPALKTVKVRPKTDELLFQREPVDGAVFAVCKPRSIAEVAPRVQATLGPEINALMARFKLLCGPLVAQPTMLPNSWADVHLHVSLYVGAGASDLELTLWMERILDAPDDSLHVLVAGDDSLVVYRPLPVEEGEVPLLYFYEFDLSMCDQSHSAPALRFEIAVAQTLGLPLESAILLDASHGAKYLVPHENGVTRVSIPYHTRATGGADTTFGNTTTVGFSLVATFAGLIRAGGHRRPAPTVQSVQGWMLAAGFKVKARPVVVSDGDIFNAEDATRIVTFLKGKWWLSSTYEEPPGEDPSAPRLKVPYTARLVWAPLPSRVLKYGKSLRDPRDLFRRAKVELEPAATAFLGQQAACYSAFALPPLLAELVRSTDTRAELSEATRLELRYKVQAASWMQPDARLVGDQVWASVCERVISVSKDAQIMDPLEGKEWVPERSEFGELPHVWPPLLEQEAALEDVCRRYEVDIESVRAAQALLQRVKPFSFVESPVFEALAMADYA